MAQAGGRNGNLNESKLEHNREVTAGTSEQVEAAKAVGRAGVEVSMTANSVIVPELRAGTALAGSGKLASGSGRAAAAESKVGEVGIVSKETGLALGKAAEGTLTVGERAEIQAIANKYNTTIDVVGSRAAGEGRNIETTLPVKKGKKFRSDIDFRIDATHPKVDDLIKDLKRVGNGAGSASTEFSTTRATYPPFIRFEPQK